MIRALIERGSVIGTAFDAWMVAPNWVRGKTTPEAAGVTLATFVDHIDHICQLAGNAEHNGIGSDLDGAFGREQTAQDLETIADLARLADLLRGRGYRDDDVDKIMHGNFIRTLREAWR
jgi:membrane dipeptidase